PHRDRGQSLLPSGYPAGQPLLFEEGPRPVDQLERRESRDPTRAPAWASSKASRASAGWRRAADRHMSTTGSAGTRAGVVTIRSVGASASASAGTRPTPRPPETYESSSDTLGTSIVD